MTKRTLVASSLTLLLLVVVCRTAGLDGSSSARWRSAHSEPAASIPARQVAITRDGKVFHDPSCPYLHGRAEMMTAEEADRAGYTPCTRCMRAALK